jgi:hypothetical protein
MDAGPLKFDAASLGECFSTFRRHCFSSNLRKPPNYTPSRHKKKLNFQLYRCDNVKSRQFKSLVVGGRLETSFVDI